MNNNSNKSYKTNNHAYDVNNVNKVKMQLTEIDRNNIKFDFRSQQVRLGNKFHYTSLQLNFKCNPKILHIWLSNP